jgi:peptide deformylase
MPVDPATLRILHYPADALRRKAAPVPTVDDEVRAVAQRMIELMREAEGIGLAAPQVGLPWRLFVAEVPPGEDRSADADPVSATLGPLVFINPALRAFEGAPEPFDEGCLSLPEITGQVLRPPQVTVEATDVEGRPFEMCVGGLLSRCVQHEHDHLDGVLIIDKMTQMSRMKNRAAVRDLERAGARS